MHGCVWVVISKQHSTGGQCVKKWRIYVQTTTILFGGITFKFLFFSTCYHYIFFYFGLIELVLAAGRTELGCFWEFGQIVNSNFVSTKCGLRSSNSEMEGFPGFTLLGSFGRPTGPPPSVQDCSLYLRLNKELEEVSLLHCSILSIHTQ